tara:strand:+ start:5724 stop:6830 length:1107 start_codon:yes stop_codon:yes gene_type:complete
MSTRKDKFSNKDKTYMRLALNLARARKGLTGNNPSVGCVLVKDDTIISIGQTGFKGRPHAESNAIKNSFENVNGSKMYVTLEPCNHYGRTPPCTINIIKSGISEVYYSIDDLDKKVKGKSSKILSKEKIKVKKGLLKKEAKNFYISYKINRLNLMPYVTGKIAVSKNNLIYSNKTKRITDKTSDKLSHFLRYKNDAIMITCKTLNTDNPKLNCRIKGYETSSPKRIILDKNLDIKLTSYIFKTIKKNNTIIFHNTSQKKKIYPLKKKGVILLKSKLDNHMHFDLREVLKKLYKLGIRNLLVEGGDKVTQEFIKKRLFNEFYLFKSSKNLSKGEKYKFFTSFTILKNKYDNKEKVTSKLAKDIITIYKR